MQDLPESVGRMVESMYEELMDSKAAASADLLPLHYRRQFAYHLFDALRWSGFSNPNDND
jgi:hypothetical protein